MEQTNSKTFANGEVSACCQVAENLEEKPSSKPDLELRVCRKCGKRHFQLNVEPGKLGVTVP